MTASATDLPDAGPTEAAELLQALIRNGCENDGSAGSGQEARNVDVLAAVLDVTGIECQRFEAAPGRDNLVARIEGSDPGGPTLLLHSALDVFPINESGWSHDPRGGDLVDGEVWGQGALDQLSKAATVAVAMRRLASASWHGRGTLTFVAAADQRSFGDLGVRWLRDHHPDLIRADWAIAGPGGFLMPGPTGLSMVASTADKGAHSFSVRLSGEANQLMFTDRPVTTGLGTLIDRVNTHRSPARLTEHFRESVRSTGFEQLLSEFDAGGQELQQILGMLPDWLGQAIDAALRSQVGITRVEGGGHPRILPGDVSAEVLVESLPDEDLDTARRVLDELLGDLDATTSLGAGSQDGNSSPFPSELWDAMEQVTGRYHPDTSVSSVVSVRPTGAEVYRSQGAVTYGYGLHSRRLLAGDWYERDRGVDERIDLESLGLNIRLWTDLAELLLD